MSDDGDLQPPPLPSPEPGSAAAAPPLEVVEFAENCSALADKLQDAANTALSLSKDVESADGFVKKIGGFFSWCSWIPGVGSVLADVGGFLTGVAVTTDDVAEKVANIANQGIQWSLDLNSVSTQVLEAGSITDAAKDALKQATDQALTPLAMALKAIF
jgi:hypothetical protein